MGMTQKNKRHLILHFKSIKITKGNIGVDTKLTKGCIGVDPKIGRIFIFIFFLLCMIGGI